MSERESEAFGGVERFFEEHFFAEEPYYLPIRDEIDIFRAAYSARLPVLLKGPTGCGKTRFVEYMAYTLHQERIARNPESAKEAGSPLITVACHEDLSASDLVGRYLLQGDETVWIDGPLTRAVKIGAICYLDEIVEARKDTTVLIHPLADAQEVGIPLTREMLEKLLKKGAKIKITQMTSKELAEASGLFVTDLEGMAQEKIEELSGEEKKKLAALLQQASVLKTEEPRPEPTFYYDEWDYLIDDYRPRWCTLREVRLEGGSSDTAIQIRKEHSALISAVRKHFQRVRPEMLRRVKRLRSGEDIELDDVIEAAVDRRAGLTPSDRIYQQKERRARDVATAFLLDLSASTDEWIVKPSQKGPGEELGEGLGEEQGVVHAPPRTGMINILAGRRKDGSESPDDRFAPPEGSKRVIDIEREALVIMAEALESLGDEYAIYGFSGYGRDNVEFLPIKEFGEAYSEAARCRIGALKPRKSTRMGPAIRHSLAKLDSTGCRLKVLILLSDGYPQDYDYGPDRSTRDYGLHDTAMALQEARRKGMHTFCVTVDQAGNDYLSEMCGGENYLVVKRPAELPRILPRIYRGLTV